MAENTASAAAFAGFPAAACAGYGEDRRGGNGQQDQDVKDIHG